MQKKDRLNEKDLAAIAAIIIALDQLTEQSSPRETRRQAINEAKDRSGVPKSQQPSRSWTIHDPERVKGRGERSRDVEAQGRMYEYEIPKKGGGTQKVYIVDHHRDPKHGGIGHIHTAGPKKGASSVEPGGRYLEEGEYIPYKRRNR